jgi:transposase
VNRKQIRDLEQLAREETGVRSLGLRARIILECSKNNSDREVAKVLRLGKFGNRTVGKWRKRFIDGGVDGLCEKPRPGAPRKASDDDVEGVVADALESASPSTRKVAERLGLNQTAVSGIVRAFGERVSDIGGIFMSPPINALVLCVAESSQTHPLHSSRPSAPRRPGQHKCKGSDYPWFGRTKLSGWLDMAFWNADQMIGKRLGWRQSKQFCQFLDNIDRHIPPELGLYLILDQNGTDETALILAERPRYHLFSTPTHAAWLNQVDRWIALLAKRQIERGSHNSVDALSHAIRDFESEDSSDLKKSQKMFRWASRCHTGRARLWKTSGAKARHTSQPSIDINYEK